jgi:hypothetical protein
MVMALPLWWMKLWFARAFRPGQGERTGRVNYGVVIVGGKRVDVPSPGPAGWNSVKRGSFDAAGLREERRELMSRGRPRRGEAVVMPVKSAMARVESMLNVKTCVSYDSAVSMGKEEDVQNHRTQRQSALLTPWQPSQCDKFYSALRALSIPRNIA